MRVQDTLPSQPSLIAKAQPTLQQGSSGSAVIDLQQRLQKAGFSPGSIDGSFGPGTKAAVIAFQRAKRLTADGIVGPSTWAALAPYGPVTTPVTGLRAKIVAEALWGVTNTAAIHYEQRRPIDGLGQRRKLPLYTDCSGFVTLCYKWAGVPEDPNGNNYNGSGYTGTLLNHMTPVSLSQVQPGDLVLWARDGVTKHVSLVVETGSDPLLVSHGQESGPYTVSFSASNRSRAGDTVYWLRLPSVDGARMAPPPGAPRALSPLPSSLQADPPAEEGLVPGEGDPSIH